MPVSRQLSLQQNNPFAYQTGTAYRIKIRMMANGENKNLPSAAQKKEEVIPEPVPFEKFNWLIHTHYVRGEIQACKDLIKSELERTKGYHEFGHYTMGKILRDDGKLQEALESFQKCLKLNRKKAANLKEVGKCLYQMHRYRLATEAYLEAEKFDYKEYPDWQIYYFLGLCFLKLGEAERAKEYAHKAVKVGKHEMSYALLIKILDAEGDLKSALAVSNAAVESCPDSVKMLTESGLLFLKTGQSQHAFERFSSALALEPTCTKALLGVGCITQKHEEYDVAMSKYKIAIHYEPDSVALWNNIGMCFYSKQKYIAAISCLKRALWVSPLNWRTLFNLGLAHLATSQPASAFNFICAAMNLRPDIPDCFALLGSALMELEDPDNAARALRQALVLSPNDPVCVVNAAVCCHAAGSVDEARNLLQRLRILIEEGVACTPEVMDLAERLTATIKEKKENSQQENTNDVSQASSDEKHNVDADAAVDQANNVEGDEMLYAEFPSGEVSQRELEPDEV